jgi:hypothetical protein
MDERLTSGNKSLNFLFCMLCACEILAKAFFSSSVLLTDPVVILSRQRPMFQPTIKGGRGIASTYSSANMNDSNPVKIVATDQAAFHLQEHG